MSQEPTEVCAYCGVECRATRFARHLRLCKKQNPNSGLVHCHWCWTHRVPRKEKEEHEKVCEENWYAEQARPKDDSVGFKAPIVKNHPQLIDHECSWDLEEVSGTYDPTKTAEDKAIFRQP